MAARITGVTFETTNQARAGRFSIPRAAANLLGIGADDPVGLRVTWEGGKLELETSLRSGLEVYPRSGDHTTTGLERIPGGSQLTVTVWRTGEEGPDEPSSAAPWDDERFDNAFELAGGSRQLIGQLRTWAAEHEVSLRYGRGRTAGPLYFDAPGPGPKLTLFSVGANGLIEWIFRNNLDRSSAISGSHARLDLVRRVCALFGGDRDAAVADTWFGMTADRLSATDVPALVRLLDEELAMVVDGRE